MIRPERLVFTKSRSEPDMNVFSGMVREIVYQGESTLSYIELADGSTVALRANTRATAAIGNVAVGDKVNIGLHVNDTVLIPAEGPDA
jgi:putative spermidine/putrescine transport system ATP-binding protein